eukprot:CAMPEP_0117467522 /NCGR_PEP_ID=MMETSP0784-20121206/5700_1 /TAXON_ID=39447 /ORGANISM="" /LENGTH=136 /DNA_ID=CAMNT_0005261495 /DNA_START=764 /DNA_END=1171 /DNA_ORIENTATION=-
MSSFVNVEFILSVRRSDSGALGQQPKQLLCVFTRMPFLLTSCKALGFSPVCGRTFAQALFSKPQGRPVARSTKKRVHVEPARAKDASAVRRTGSWCAATGGNGQSDSPSRAVWPSSSASPRDESLTALAQQLRHGA